MPTIYVLSRNMKISEFLSKNFQFLVLKFSIYLNRHVFIMLFGEDVVGSMDSCSRSHRSLI